MVNIGNFFSYVGGIFSNDLNIMFTLIFFTAVMVIYSIFVFYFYRFLAKKNIISVNLSQYNNYENPTLTKFFAVLLYILEYVVLLPIVTFLWFTTLAVLILILADGIAAATVLLISAALVASVRATSYISESLSKDLAKMVPFTFLAIAITKPSFFEIDLLIGRITEIPSLLTDVPYYLIFIISIEIIMRIADTLNNFIKPVGSHDEATNTQALLNPIY